MYIGQQTGDLSDRNLTWLAQLGVEHLVVDTTEGIERADGAWDVAAIRDLQARLARFGMTLDVLTLGLDIRNTPRRFPGIVRGLPSRDAEIATLQQRIRAAGEAGVPCLKYNFTLLGFLRTGTTPGRGGARYSHFDLAKWTDHSLTEAGPVPAERSWDNIAYLLERIVPEAEAAGVRLACHPHDPPGPPEGLRGVVRVLGSVEGLKRFVAIAPSPYHGLNFCQGTVAEGCVDPAREVPEAIRHFGEADKIFMVHSRNIRGGFLNFEEVYPDEGDIDMYGTLRAYKEAGYDGIICPDHVPQSDVDPGGERQFAFCLGYLRALIQVVEGPAPNQPAGQQS